MNVISRKSFVSLVALLFAITSISRLATSLYLPALPIIGKELHINETFLGLSLTVYFGGFAFFTLIAGPLSDNWGRRKVLLIGGSIFLVGSLVCALAQGGYSLLLGRFLQAIGACSIPVTCRAMVRDAFSDEQVITVIGWMGALGALVPALAPVIGGVITEHAGWRYTFLFLSVSCLLVLLFAGKILPETLAVEKRQPLTLVLVFKRFITILTNRNFIFAILPIIFCFAIQGVYFTCAPFVFIKQLGLTPIQFGLTNIVLVASLVAGRVLCPVLIRLYNTKTTYLICGFLSFGAGVGFVALFYIVNYQLWQILLPASLFGLSFGTMVPIGVKEALTIFKHQSGSASALYGCLTLGASGLFSAISGVGMHMDISATYVMAAVSAFCCMLILLSTVVSFFKTS